MFGWEHLPVYFLENVMIYLNLGDFLNCALSCKNWFTVFEDENSEVWRYLCSKKMNEEVMKSDICSNLPTYKSKLRACYYAWNPLDCSRNMYVKANNFTIHRNPVAQSTDGCRGKFGATYGRHCWEIWWEGCKL